MVWEMLDSDIVAVGAQATTMTVSFSGNEKDHLQCFGRFFGSSVADLICEITMGGGSGTVHKYRWANNNTASTSSGSNGSIEDQFLDTGGTNVYIFMDMLNVSDISKLIRTHSINSSTAGAGNTPESTEAVGKFEETGAQINSITFTSNTNTFDENSELVVLGTD
tara:strand:+ start:1182 stop:1676 length:495 start_codon:yes stop_codon:yes gene_type:complete